MERKLLLSAAVSCLMLGGSVLRAQAVEPVILTPDRNEYLIGSHVEILNDPEKKYTIEDVSAQPVSSLFRPSKAEIPNFGFGSSAHWLRFTVVNHGGERRSWVLEFQAPTVDHVDLYVPGPAETFVRWSAGDAVPMKERNS